MAAGGGLTGGASYTYEIGPDGQRYAVGGEVSIDTSPVPNDAQATLAKANRIQAAALAPAQPSNQDRAVASAAAAMAAEARAAIMSERLNGDEDSDRSSNNSPEETSHDASNSSSPTELSSKEANSENTPLAESSSAKSLAIETYQQTIDNPTGAPSISQTINIVA